jgi:hypothetical protein
MARKIVRVSKRGRKNEGRPSKYKPEYCQQIIDFFCIEPTHEVKQTFITKAGIKEVTKNVPSFYPTIEKFAFTLGVMTETIVAWTKEYPEFFTAYTRAKEMQKNVLLQNALMGGYSEGFAKFLAINNHGMKEKSETALTGADGDTLKVIVQKFSGEV